MRTYRVLDAELGVDETFASKAKRPITHVVLSKVPEGTVAFADGTEPEAGVFSKHGSLKAAAAHVRTWQGYQPTWLFKVVPVELV